MQRHRYGEVSAEEDFAAGAVHPAPEGVRHVCMVRMFQPKNEAAAVLIVTEHRASPIPGSLLAGTITAHGVVAHRMWKRQAAADAPRRCEKGNPAPALPAQRI